MLKAMETDSIGHSIVPVERFDFDQRLMRRTKG